MRMNPKARSPRLVSRSWQREDRKTRPAAGARVALRPAHFAIDSSRRAQHSVINGARGGARRIGSSPSRQVDCKYPLAPLPRWPYVSPENRMELAFQTRELRAISEDPDAFADALQEVVRSNLRSRLADLRAATSIADLIAGRPRLSSESPPRLILDLGGGVELACHANHPSPPVDADGRLDWSRVHRLKVVSISVGGDTAR